MLDSSVAASLVEGSLLPQFLKDRKRLDEIDKWARWDHDKPHSPRQPTPEYRELVKRAQAPYLGLVVNAVVQGLYVDGYRRADQPDDAAPWHYWQVNGMDKRQIAVHRAPLTYGVAYMTVLPGRTHLGEKIPVMRGQSPRRMMAFYEEPAEDDWPEYAIRAEPVNSKRNSGWKIRLYDDSAIYNFTCAAGGSGVTLIDGDNAIQIHDLGVCPVVRYTNMLDLEGRADGEVEPLIPLQARIDQTTFDRLVVQRFASWAVRTIAGMESPAEAADPENPTASELAAAKLRLRVEDILVAEDKDTKFGSLPASPLDGFISAHDSDLRDLVAVSQTAPHYLLGQLVNLSAEALAAAETGASRKKLERQMSFGESHEQALRLGAHIMGETDAAQDMEAQVVWRDVESRSLAQAADALGKLAAVGVPLEMLLEKLPGWTQQDVKRATDLIKEQGGIDLMMQHLIAGNTPPGPAPTPGPPPVPVPAA